MATALYPGSFDPLHLGHLSVIEKAAAMFDDVVIAVIGNPRKHSGLLSVEDRIALIERSTLGLPNVSCRGQQGLTVAAVRQAGADVIIRTGHKDKGDEWSMQAMNELMAGIKTCYISPPAELLFLSSTLVRSLLARDRLSDATRLVPTPVAESLSAVSGTR